MRKTTLLLVLFALTAVSGFSQIQLSQYMLDESVYNPAFTGSEKAIIGDLFYRNQWMGFEDSAGNRVAPRTFIFSLQSPIYSINSGFGINVYSDKLGLEQNFGVKINYAYRLSVAKNQSLGFGLALSLLNKTVDFSKVIVEDPGDPLLKFGDKESATFADIDLGVHYRFVDKAYAGISITNLMQSSREIGNVRYGRKMNLYLNGGYYFRLGDFGYKKLYLVPSFLLKTNFTSSQIDVNLMVDFNHQYWGGVSWRYQDAVVLMAGLKWNGFKLGVAYDFTTGNLSKVSKGSLEIFVGYFYPIKPKVKPKSLYNTRYL